jgi:hypothetical protein
MYDIQDLAAVAFFTQNSLSSGKIDLFITNENKGAYATKNDYIGSIPWD